MKTDKYNNTHNMATPMSKTPEHSLGAEDETAPNSATLKKSNLKKKKQINYYISKEDLQHLIQNTRYSEQELRWILLHKSISWWLIFPPTFWISFWREWHQNFREECPEGILDKEKIMKIYDEISPFGNSKDFVDHIFRIFDKDGDGTIDFKEFMIATDLTTSGTPEEKLRWAFKVGT